MAYAAQASFDETRNNFGGVRRVAKLVRIDDGMHRLIPDHRLLDVSIIDCHQPTAVIVTDRIFDLNHHQLTLGSLK